MTGQHAFNQMVTEVTASEDIQPRILQEDFELWKKDVIWDALHGQRYGQSFCNRFGISDNLIYYSTWPPEQMEDYIRKHYIERSRI
jgi:hypothetical protein